MGYIDILYRYKVNNQAQDCSVVHKVLTAR